ALRILVGAANRSDYDRRAAFLPDLRQDRNQLRGWIGVRAITEHYVEQDHRDLRIGGFLQHPVVAQAQVDHRVRPAPGEDVVAEVDEGVLVRLPWILDRLLRIDRRVRPHVSKKGRSLVAESAAAEETPDIALPSLEFQLRHLQWRSRWARRLASL